MTTRDIAKADLPEGMRAYYPELEKIIGWLQNEIDQNTFDSYVRSEADKAGILDDVGAWVFDLKTFIPPLFGGLPNRYMWHLHNLVGFGFVEQREGIDGLFYYKVKGK